MPGKRSKSDAFKALDATLDRARAFLRLFDGDGRSGGKPSKDEVELLRGSVVFSVGALDAYLHDVVLEIVPHFSVKSPELATALNTIAKDRPGLALEVVLASTGSAADAREVFKAALGEHLSKVTFQGISAVQRALAYVGVTCGDFEKYVGRTGAAKDLDHFTKMRHSMVHRAAKPKIKRSEAQSCLELVEQVATKINADIIAKFYR